HLLPRERHEFRPSAWRTRRARAFPRRRDDPPRKSAAPHHGPARGGPHLRIHHHGPLPTRAAGAVRTTMRNDAYTASPARPSNAWWKNWKALALGVLLAAPPIALGSYFVVAPMNAGRDRLEAVLAKLREKNAQSKDVHDHWPEFQAKA